VNFEKKRLIGKEWISVKE